MKLISASILTFLTLKEWTSSKDESKVAYLLLPAITMWLVVLGRF